MASTIRGNDNFDSAAINGQRGELIYEGGSIHTGAAETIFQFGVTGSNYAWYEILIANRLNQGYAAWWGPTVGTTRTNLTAFQGSISSGRMGLFSGSTGASSAVRLFIYNNPDPSNTVGYFLRGFTTGMSTATWVGGIGGGTTSSIQCDGISLYTSGAWRPDIKVYGIKA